MAEVHEPWELDELEVLRDDQQRWRSVIQRSAAGHGVTVDLDAVAVVGHDPVRDELALRRTIALLLERHRRWLAWAQQDQDVWQVRRLLGAGAGAADSPWHEANEAVKELVQVEPKGDRARELVTVLRLLLLADRLGA